MNFLLFTIIAIHFANLLNSSAIVPQTPRWSTEYYQFPFERLFSAIDYDGIDEKQYFNMNNEMVVINDDPRIVTENMKSEMPFDHEFHLTREMDLIHEYIGDQADFKLCTLSEPIRHSMCARAARAIYGENYYAITFINSEYMPPSPQRVYSTNPYECVNVPIADVFQSRWMFYCNDPVLKTFDGEQFKADGYFILGSVVFGKIYVLTPTKKIWCELNEIPGSSTIINRGLYNGYWMDPGTADPAFEMYSDRMYEPLVVNLNINYGYQYLFYT